MSTNPKELTPTQSSEAIITKNKTAINRNVRALIRELEHENTLLAETPLSRVQRVLKIYRSVKPLFDIVSALPLLPATWRAGIVLLTQALDALVSAGPDLTAQFKAGKDI